VGAFLDLVHLRWLDLSNNRIKAIEPHTFDGLTLQHLFVNGNRNVQIFPTSFSGLATTGLYLHDCALRHVDPESLVQLNFTLRYLWLNGNELERVDRRLRQLFDVLLHLRLGSNPLRCNCWAVWLKRFLDESPVVFQGAVPPTCLRPRALKGRRFTNITVHDLRCRVINNTYSLRSPRVGCRLLLRACLSLGLSVCEHISETARPKFTKFPLHVICVRGSIWCRRVYATSMTSVRLSVTLVDL